MKTMTSFIRTLLVLFCCLGGLLAHPVSAAPVELLKLLRRWSSGYRYL